MKKILFALCVLAAPAFADPQGADEHARVELAPSAKAFKLLEIDNPLGDVRVEGYDGQAIQIETHKHAPDEETLERLRVSLVPNPDGTVHIRTMADKNVEGKPAPASSVRVDLVIRAPRDARVDASVIAGKLEVEGMDAGGELDAASGSISVHDVQGELSTHSVSGPTSLAEVFGSVDAATISADMQLDTIGGERLIATANHGSIEGRRVRARDVELTTTEGKIVLEAEASLRGRITVASLRGDVDVRLHRHGAVVVRALGAKVDLGGSMVPRTSPDGWMTSSFGMGDLPAIIELRSRYGSIQFVAID